MLPLAVGGRTSDSFLLKALKRAPPRRIDGGT
jgi:hypothetical protein